MDINIYEPCDKAIKGMNRLMVEDFGRMKLAKWDEVHVVRTVMTVYRRQRRKAREAYYEVAFEAYLLAMAIMDMAPGMAHQMAEKAINEDWVNELLTEPDPVTHYEFDAETERKAYRLAEALEIVPDRNMEIDRALRDLSKQFGQYAINATDRAVIQAYKDAGVKQVVWVSEGDSRVCTHCRGNDGKTFDIEKIPVKPHWGCRCRLRPVKKVSPAKAD